MAYVEIGNERCCHVVTQLVESSPCVTPFDSIFLAHRPVNGFYWLDDIEFGSQSYLRGGEGHSSMFYSATSHHTSLHPAVTAQQSSC